jgi:ferredoxin
VKILINKDACVGNARCAAISEELFELDDEGYIAVTEVEVPPELEGLAKRHTIHHGI